MARKAENDKHKAKKGEEAPERSKHQDRAPFRGLPPRVPPPQAEAPPRQQRTVNEVTRFDEYTPLNKPQEEILHLIKNQPFFRAPGSYRDGQPQQGPNNKLCEYHNSYGHYTKHCGHLEHQLELLVRQGNLDQFIARVNEGQAQRPEQRNEPQQDQGKNRDRRPEDNRDNRRGEVQGREPPFPYRREVHMIFRENGTPTSNRAKKQVVRAVKIGYYPKLVMEITSAAEEPVISFGSEDLRTLVYPHDDALVFTADIASCVIHRVFVDSGSAVNILYLECLRKMGIEANVEPTNSPLFGFGGEIVMPIGFVELPVTLGRRDVYKNRMIRFLVVDMPSPLYNVILGRHVLTAFRAVISMFHWKMKFPIGGGRVGEVWGD
ncbi:uncharacterized protein LOC131004172 [Salvia miltiorrhiza]|uniref:uncharacterized protein LOC131004172 n=1 Tax=Salvia miltiorrhiza TaxID=226208 RepID=UPI0025AD2220|nr:uncharacterized protein LOC131004172 [Salvia miltiorrhiza]